MKHQQNEILVFTLAAMIAAATPTLATVCIWTNTTDGVFSDATMWNGGVPGINDAALFTRTASYAVSCTVNASSSNAVFTSNTSGRVALELGAFTWTLYSTDTSASPLIIGRDSGSTSSVMLASGNVVTPSLTIGDATGASGLLIVSNGMLQAGGMQIGRSQGASGTLSISNGQVTVNGGGVGSVLLGQSGVGTINVTGGTLVVTNLSSAMFQIGRNIGSSGALYLTGNGQILSDGTLYVGYGNANSVTGTVVQTGGTWTHRGDILLGRNNAVVATMVVAGGRLMTSGAVYVGSNATVGSTFTISNQGVVVAAQMRAGRDGNGNHRVTVADGGLLEANSLVADSAPGCTISNVAGVFQFTTNTPQVQFASGMFGRIAITNGTVSFRNITDADIKGNWSGSLTGLLFSGANTFRLDTATNLVAGQGYTFSAALGATNYARLELFSGANYRGGNVMIGAGGSLTATGAVSRISSNLSFLSGGTYQVWLGSGGIGSQVAVGADVDLGGATLDVRLSAPPPVGYRYVVIDNQGPNPISGNFVSKSVVATFEGTNYTMTSIYGGGDGNDLVVWRAPLGMTLLVK